MDISFQTVDKVALEFTSQSNFSFMKQILYKIKFLRVFLSFNSPLFSLIFASFFKFIHAYVSPTFISVAAQNFCHNFSLFLTQIFGKYFRNLIHETEGFLPSVFLTFKMIITLLFNVGYNDLFFDFYLFLRKGCNLFLKLIDSVTYLLTLFA